MMSKVELTLALSRYDHTEDLVTGRVPVEGVDLNYLDLPLHDIFYRFIHFRDFDLAEMSMAKYVSLVSQGDDSVTALPVFPSRVARHSSIYVRRDGPVKKAADLAGRQIGVPEWAQTAAVYSRGLLMHHFGIDLSSIHWFQAGEDEPGRREKVALKLPSGLRLSSVADKTLTEMLSSGELDAILVAQPPRRYLEGGSNVVRLFDDYLAQEKRYVRETKILPIMHTVAMKRSILDRWPWVAANLMRGFEQAKNNSLERALYAGATRFPIPWCFEYARQAQEIWGKDYWPYGVERNRATLDLFLQYAYEQGVCHKRLQPEDLFPPQVVSQYRV
jgi:4,5-dihydroxyphthalate decarboxylase